MSGGGHHGRSEQTEVPDADPPAKVFDRITDAVVALDEEFRFTYLNEQAERLLEADAEALLGERIWDEYPEARGTEIHDALREALETQQSTEGELYYEPLEFWVSARIYPSESGLSVYFRDVTELKEQQRELDYRTALLEAQAETTIDGQLVVDADRRIRHYNERFAELWDIPEAVLEDRSDERALEYVLDSVADPEEFRAKVEYLYENPEEESRDEIRLADGRWIDRYSAPVIGEHGTYYGRLWVFRDITEHKEREQYLEDAKSQLEAATEAGAVGTWEWHVQDDEMVGGASLAKTFGVDPEAAREGLPLERFLDAIHEADRDRVEAAVEAALDSGGDYEEEYRVRDADGDVRWVVARGHVECDEDGRPIRFPGALTDITERKRAELQLQRSNEQLETLFDVLPVGVIVVDADGRLLEANDVARDVWGADVADVAEADEFVARWAESGESVAPEEWVVNRVLRGEQLSEPDVYEIHDDDGAERIVMVDGEPITDEFGDVRRGVVTIRDVTERREYRRKLEASNERLQQFAHAVSHDLREPLRMVSSYLQLLEERYGADLDEEAGEFIEFAVDGADRMREMIEGLLAYSRVEQRGEPFEPVDLDGVLEDVLENLQLRIEEHHAEVTSEPLPTVLGDRSQLQELFQNLLDNAIEYSGDGPPRVHVAAERAGSDWIVSVSDEGVGIDPDDQDRVFDVFQRLQPPDEDDGIGIGLTLCQRIVERHGGDIQVDSEPGDGTTFSFSLPGTDAA